MVKKDKCFYNWFLTASNNVSNNVDLFLHIHTYIHIYTYVNSITSIKNLFFLN